jgi:hypothetical protein
MTTAMRTSHLALLPVLFAAACGATTRFVATNPAPHPMVARPAETVQVFTTGHPTRPYVEVGIIQGQQGRGLIHNGDQMPEIITKMREDAARTGCDGLIINGNADRVVGDRHSTGTVQGFWGACIVFMPEAASASASAAPAPATTAPAAAAVTP